MIAKGSPAYYAARRQPARLSLDEEMAQRRATARAAGMFDEPAERHGFEAYFRHSRAGRGATYVDRLFERLPDGTYARPEAQRHFNTWSMAVGGGRLLPKFDAIKLAADRAAAAAWSGA